ncbi:MAG: radical SAM family heme chaperone HemW [Chloroflexota bacterium]
MLEPMTNRISIYIHIPFCRHRCAYCDFNTYAGQENLMPAYIRALQAELKQVASFLSPSDEIGTIFFGGGTPTYLPVEGLAEILKTTKDKFNLSSDCEISIEANPGTVQKDSLTILREIGFNRLSLGMQSGNLGELRLLEREHDPVHVIQAVRWAREAGFENINLDLIFGIPYQSLTSWQQSLQLALSLKPEHLSLYALTLEHGTPFKKWVDRGLVAEPDDDLAAEQYDYACEVLAEAGFLHYEISNWAVRRNGQSLACRHNLQYWRYLPYIGAGAGAHGFLHNYRTINVRGIGVYIERMSIVGKMPFPASSVAEQVIELDLWTQMQEKMMVGLRLLEEGVGEEAFYHQFGIRMEDVFGDTINQLIHSGLLEWVGETDRRCLRLSRRAWLVGNRVFREFVGVPEPSFIRDRCGYSTTTRVP